MYNGEERRGEEIVDGCSSLVLSGLELFGVGALIWLVV